MRIPKKVLIGLVAATLASGCASSGGSGKVTNADGTASDMTGEDFLLCLLTAGLACGGKPASVTASPAPLLPPPLPAFTSWSASPPGEYLTVSGVAGVVTYEASGGLVSSVSAPLSISQEQYSAVNFNEQRNFTYLLINGFGLPSRNSASPFAGIPVSLPNPLAMGWEYQSFGVWDHNNQFAKMLVATSFGAATPGSAVPLTGAASFTGKLSGLYVSPTGQGAGAAADLTVSANFSARSLSFASSGTTLTPAGATASAAAHLNLGGTLTYAPGSGTFSGTLTSAGGTLSGSSTGRFYGPAAQELGGVFTLKSATTMETFAGAYGAKR